MIAALRAEIVRIDENAGRPDLGNASTGSPFPGIADIGIRLRRAVFDPLTPALNACPRLLIAPDSALTCLPFEVLPTDDGKYLIDRYSISYLSAGRDLLRFSTTTQSQANLPLVIADPDFDLSNDIPSVGRKAEKQAWRHSRDLGQVIGRFCRLPGTAAEGKCIAEMLGVQPWLEGAALEARLKSYTSPRILHLATHGFFLDQPHFDVILGSRPFKPTTAGTDAGFRQPAEAVVESPLLRSGVALAGANTFLHGKLPPPAAEDGILTAEDVTGLDMFGTELVVLSACDTGLGVVRTGEGVFGLRRAFVQAGARTLVMSLWRVGDEETMELMVEFYRHLLAGKGRAEALRGAQLVVRDRHPHPRFWGAFICQGDLSAMSREK
jgi:CHAT domain-containing protein